MKSYSKRCHLSSKSCLKKTAAFNSLKSKASKTRQNLTQKTGLSKKSTIELSNYKSSWLKPMQRTNITRSCLRRKRSIHKTWVSMSPRCLRSTLWITNHTLLHSLRSSRSLRYWNVIYREFVSRPKLAWDIPVLRKINLFQLAIISKTNVDRGLHLQLNPIKTPRKIR